MKTHHPLSAALLLAAALCVPALAQVPSTPNEDNPSPATGPTVALTSPDPFAEMFAVLEAATPDNHDGLSDVQRRMDQSIDAQVNLWKSSGYNVTLAADEKLDTATEDFAEKLRLLTLSTDETWETAKHNAEMALREVRSAYTAIGRNSERY